MTATSLVAVAGTSAVIRGLNQLPRPKKNIKRRKIMAKKKSRKSRK